MATPTTTPPSSPSKTRGTGSTRRKASGHLKDPILLGDGDWSGLTLITPGKFQGTPTLWARDNSTRALYTYSLAFDSSGLPPLLHATTHHPAADPVAEHLSHHRLPGRPQQPDRRTRRQSRPVRHRHPWRAHRIPVRPEQCAPWSASTASSARSRLQTDPRRRQPVRARRPSKRERRLNGPLLGCHNHRSLVNHQFRG